MKDEHHSRHYQYHQPQMNTIAMDYGQVVSSGSNNIGSFHADPSPAHPDNTDIDEDEYDDDINEEEEDMEGPARYIEKTLDVVDEEDDQNALEMEMIRQLTQPMLTTMPTSSSTIKEQKKTMETIAEKVEEEGGEETVQQQPAKSASSSSFNSSAAHKRNKSKARKRGNSLEDKIRKLILENEAASTSGAEGRSDDCYYDSNSRFYDSHSSRVSRTSTSYSSTSSSSIGRIHDVVVLSTDDILNDLGKTEEEVEITSSSYGHEAGEDGACGAFPSLLDRGNVTHFYEQEHEEEKERDDRADDDEEKDVRSSHSQMVSSKDGTVQKGTTVSNVAKKHEEQKLPTTTTNSICLSDKWTAFGSFPGLSENGHLDENGFPILESQTPSSPAVVGEKPGDKIIDEEIQHDDSSSEAEEEEELAKTLAAEFQQYEEEGHVANSRDENNGGQLLDDSSEIFDNLASMSGNIDNDTGTFNELDGRRQSNHNDNETSFTRSISRMATLGQVPHDLEKTEQQTFQEEIEKPTRSDSPLSLRKKEGSVASLDSSNKEIGSPVSNMDSSSVFSSSSVGSNSPSSVTQFSGSGSLSSHHKRYREFARKRNRSRPMRRRVDLSPVKSTAQLQRTRDELMGEVPRNTSSLRKVEKTQWRPDPPKHYNRPTNRI